MRIDLEFYESHIPVFIAGVNLGTKLYSEAKKNRCNEPLTIWHMTDTQTTFIKCRDKVAIITATGIGVLSDNTQAGVEAAKEKKQIAPIVATPVPGLRSAQVETPHSKVQDTTKRKAKYQGEVVE